MQAPSGKKEEKRQFSLHRPGENPKTLMPRGTWEASVGDAKEKGVAATVLHRGPSCTPAPTPPCLGVSAADFRPQGGWETGSTEAACQKAGLQGATRNAQGTSRRLNLTDDTLPPGPARAEPAQAAAPARARVPCGPKPRPGHRRACRGDPRERGPTLVPSQREPSVLWTLWGQKPGESSHRHVSVQEFLPSPERGQSTFSLAFCAQGWHPLRGGTAHSPWPTWRALSIPWPSLLPGKVSGWAPPHWASGLLPLETVIHS